MDTPPPAFAPIPLPQFTIEPPGAGPGILLIPDATDDAFIRSLEEAVADAARSGVPVPFVIRDGGAQGESYRRVYRMEPETDTSLDFPHGAAGQMWAPWRVAVTWRRADGADAFPVTEMSVRKRQPDGTLAEKAWPADPSPVHTAKWLPALVAHARPEGW